MSGVAPRPLPFGSARILFVTVFALLQCVVANGIDYYVDAMGGDDSRNGRTEANAWQTLSKASAHNFRAGDRLLFKRGEVFYGGLDLTYETSGTSANPILIGSYGTSTNHPVVNATGLDYAVELGSSDYIELNDLEITGSSKDGIYVATWGAGGQLDYSGLQFRNLIVHDVGGHGIKMVTANESDRYFKDVVIADCVFSNIGSFGITINKWKGDLPQVSTYNEQVTITNNLLMNIGDAGIQVGKIIDCLVRDNTVIDPGYLENGNGSGMWTWYCRDLICEYNVFKGGRGDTDACGVHIDIGNYNNIVQYNLSMENEGGFVEVLGLSSNCVYRYNISINDGSRIKGENHALQHGKTFWLGGYTGPGSARSGPFNCYIYNNSIFVRSNIVSKYKMESTVEGALFANNIIYVEGTAEDVSIEWPYGPGVGVIFDNNLVFQNKVPLSPFNSVTNNWAADPQYLNGGGLKAVDYKAVGFEDIIDKGIVLYTVPGDSIGVVGGFAVTEDILGNPILGTPDMGAIEAESEFSSLLAWMSVHGIALDENLADDLNGDGVSLLTAYSQNLDPNQDLSEAMPSLEYNHPTGSMDYVYPGIAESIAYELQETCNLTNSWIGFTSGILTGPDIDGHYTARIPVTNVLEQLFLRLDTRLK